ncbi:hypothetical protein [Halobellus salinisoli]|uniref:hypothetical protein n=1 Tax=Halobellus salinisoli TaxID=3108500 RepID=UPI0030082E6A
MPPSDEYEEKIANSIEEIYDLQLEALRRAGVANEKEQGLEIESTEAVRLFREATGYLLRMRELRDDVEMELRNSQFYHIERVIGHIEDYNRILQDIRKNDSFENAIQSFNELSYGPGNKQYANRAGYKVTIEGRSDFVPSIYVSVDGLKGKQRQQNVPMDGTTIVENFVYPRLIRLTKDVENSLIGRCASGKRP